VTIFTNGTGKIFYNKFFSPVLLDWAVLFLKCRYNFISCICRQIPKSLKRVGKLKLKFMKKTISIEGMSQITGGRREMVDDLVCGILATGLGIITFGLGAVAAIACWVIAEDIHI